MFKKLFLVPILAVLAASAFSHDSRGIHSPLREWQLNDHRHLHGSFLMMRNDTVFLENEKGSVQPVLFSALSKKDQGFARGKMDQIEQLNQSSLTNRAVQLQEYRSVSKSRALLFGFVLLAFAFLGASFVLIKNKKMALAFSLGCAVILFAFRSRVATEILGTDPLFMDSAFGPFKPNVSTRWDNTWFYVESKGIPTTHSMMAGITKWQQQVPIPQCYIGSNAWQIPLNPVLAQTPVPVNQQHFLRGAVAIAANGIPIFNPYTNTGVDAFLDGQLDRWGGHCGRADDYHYHIAPLFLDTQTVDILPIAFALDGFAVYADREPDGSAMMPLDSNHGHFDGKGGYHYHGSATAPYMIGNMVGQVTEDATMQIIPQARAMPVRPSLTPLTGATITDCKPNSNANGYTLTYTKGGETYKVDYEWTKTGVYTFRFISPGGTTTETYNGHAPCELPSGSVDIPENNWDLVVYPNPTQAGFTINLWGLNTGDIRQITLYDAEGKRIWTRSSSFETLPVIEEQGVYLIKIAIGQNEISRKIIVH